MSKKSYQQQGARSPFLLAEEAMELALSAGLAPLSIYLVGTLPFLVGVVTYWAAMSSSAYAHHYASAGAFGLALLFIWMKAFQARYAQLLLAKLHDEDAAPWTLRQFFTALSRQGAVHASVILLYPICFVTVLPMCFVATWFQNLTVLESSATSTRGLIRDAAAQARLWPKQSHLFLWLSSPLMMIAGAVIYLGTFPILDGLVTPDLGETALLTLGYVYGGIVLVSILPLSPFACLVFVNWATGIFFLFELFHILTGADTFFSKNPMLLVGNSTFIATACALTYLCLDPVLKAGFTIRCYHGLSLQSGSDLRVELTRLRQCASKAAAAILLATLAAFTAQPAAAQEQPDGQPQTASIDQALDEELAAARYTWRMPREPNPDVEMPWLLQALSDLGQTIRDGIGATIEFLWDLWESFTDWLRGSSDTSASGWGNSSFNPTWRHLVVLLIVVLVAATLYLVWRWLRSETPEVSPMDETLPPPPPDLADEATTAAELPEDEWFKLARELAAKGDFRLAARALFFSSLAVLAQREFIRIARFKSNMDYANEVKRRATAAADAPDAFSESALIYESVWYGEHIANAETLNQLHACQERLRHAGN